ncbi:RACGAP1 [Acanthosepion pharaonis]|uniref:RACGAP1 n=1 Tax=Acanthosepion pharaonis TaxID=158019 RepID=A0A812DDY8_ACAPH|nr:RACGAP1 [Sepia pharaonis]
MILEQGFKLEAFSLWWQITSYEAVVLISRIVSSLSRPGVHKAYSHWFQTEKDILKLREDLRKCQQEKATLEIELKHARSQIKLEFQKRTQVENDRNTLEKLIEMIQSLLNDKNKSVLDEKDMKKLAFLNSYQRSDVGKRKATDNHMRESSASCLSDISYDVTDDDLDVSVSKDFQTEGTPPKKKRTSRDADTSIVTRTSVHLDPESGKPHATTTTQINMPKLNKSFSEPLLDVQFKKSGCDSDEEEVWTLRPGQTPRSRKRNSKSSHQRTQSDSDSPFLRKANSASSGLNKIHIFMSKTVIKPEYCQPCGVKIKFGKMAMRCKECKIICHPESQFLFLLSLFYLFLFPFSIFFFVSFLFFSFSLFFFFFFFFFFLFFFFVFLSFSLFCLFLFFVFFSFLSFSFLFFVFFFSLFCLFLFSFLSFSFLFFVFCLSLFCLLSLFSFVFVFFCLCFLFSLFSFLFVFFSLCFLFSLFSFLFVFFSLCFLFSCFLFLCFLFLCFLCFLFSLFSFLFVFFSLCFLFSLFSFLFLCFFCCFPFSHFLFGENAERQVKELKEKFWKGKSTPNLSLVDDINVVCACLKDFLRNLKESLITYRLWPEFVKAVTENKNTIDTALYEAISKLPSANRDTLAFLIKHLQLVGHTPECRMPIQNLAKVFGPTIVGFSHPEPEAKDILHETKLQSMVMEQLLVLPANYWNNYFQPENFPDENIPTSPEDKQVLHSMLGPVGITPTGSSSKFNQVTPTPKFVLRNRDINKQRKNFFDSPTLE